LVAIVCDSAANLPPDLARNLGVQVVPMYVRFGDETYRDGTDIATADFYRRLAEHKEVASSATPGWGDFLEAYEATGQRDVVCVTVAGSMSAANHQAALAAERFHGRVEVVDSMTASMGEGFVALEAAYRGASGGSLEEVAARARQVAERTELLAMVETFEYLQRSGRVKKLQAYAATMLDIKPVFRFERGDVQAVARPRTRRRALERIEAEAVKLMAGRPAHVAALHAAAENDALELLTRIRDQVDVREEFLTAVTPVIGAHVGPGLVGMAFFCE